jgi:hypothetical protein
VVLGAEVFGLMGWDHSPQRLSSAARSISAGSAITCVYVSAVTFFEAWPTSSGLSCRRRSPRPCSCGVVVGSSAPLASGVL